MEGSAAIVPSELNDNVFLSFRNIPRTHVLRASDLNSYDVLWHRHVVFVDDAWDVLIQRLAGGAGATEQEAEA